MRGILLTTAGLTVSLLVMFNSVAFAVPGEINFQGYLTDTNGVPVDGLTNITFRIYNVDTGPTGDALWSEQKGVDVANGVYSVVLGEDGDNSLSPAIFADQLYLGIEIETDGEMVPRQKLTAVGYAIKAISAESADSVDWANMLNVPAGFNDGIDDDTTYTPGTGIDITGTTISNTGDTNSADDLTIATSFAGDITGAYNNLQIGAGAIGSIEISPPIALGGSAAGDGVIRGTNANTITASSGISGVSTAAGGTTYGVFGQSDSTSGRGVMGVSTAATGATSGVYGTSSSTTGRGLTGIVTSTTGVTYGVLGISGSEPGKGVMGWNQSSTGVAEGVQGQSDSSTGRGVYGYASSSAGQNYGVLGHSISAAGTGVRGTAPLYGVSGYASAGSGTNYGVYGESASPSGHGVYGRNTAGGYAGYFTSTSGYGLIVESGNVGIGTTTPGEKLTVAGMIESTSGGVKFPDATLQTSAAPTYKRTVIVNPVPGYATLSGAALLSALAGITDATADNPYLLKIEPGVYDIKDNALYMKEYVDIEGSGENTTKITSNNSGTVLDATSATIVGADNAEIRFLTVENRGGINYSIAIYNYNTSPDISNITANAFGGISQNYGMYNDNSSSPTMTDVIVTASGGFSYGVYNDNFSSIMTDMIITVNGETSYGVYNHFSSPIMTNVTISSSGNTAGYGVYNAGSFPIIRNSSISSTASIRNIGGSTAMIGATMLDGAVAGIVFICVGAYDASFTALGTDCL